MVDYSDILNSSCTSESLPGLTRTALFASACSEIDTWPELPAAPTTNSELVTISGNFSMLAGKYFHTIEIIPLSGSVKNTLQGQQGSRSYKALFAFKLAGSADAKEAFDRKIKNDEFAFIAEEADGTKRLIGTKNFPAIIESVEQATGENPENDAYETVYVVKGPVNVGLAPKYTGTIPLDPGGGSSS